MAKSSIATFAEQTSYYSCFVTLVFDDREVAYEVFESDEVGGKSRVWSCFPEKMLCSYAVSQTIRKHFKDAVEAVEKGL